MNEVIGTGYNDALAKIFVLAQNPLQNLRWHRYAFGTITFRDYVVRTPCPFCCDCIVLSMILISGIVDKRANVPVPGPIQYDLVPPF